MANFTDEELCIIAIILDEETEEEKTPKRRKWVHEAWQKKDSEGEFLTLYKELIEDGTKFYQYFRMSEYCFNTLLEKLYVYLKKKRYTLEKSYNTKGTVSSLPQVCYKITYK
ncbi:unnamed protein product [Macrosiphum euphorbiae]|uniref:Uncharacterized protein n=1 Tax=Macrosiphum euphorbiae TaxID=13131 RepID=A0AAV0WIE2_9HEMI|nr:unnamed protein product [Macrosiphum euphorbiae]